jgi:hypothetical protein
MAENEETNAKRDDNGCYEKDAICASFTNLQKWDPEVQESNARSKFIEARAKLLTRG